MLCFSHNEGCITWPGMWLLLILMECMVAPQHSASYNNLHVIDFSRCTTLLGDINQSSTSRSSASPQIAQNTSCVPRTYFNNSKHTEAVM